VTHASLCEKHLKFTKYEEQTNVRNVRSQNATITALGVAHNNGDNGGAASAVCYSWQRHLATVAGHW